MKWWSKKPRKLTEVERFVLILFGCLAATATIFPMSAQGDNRWGLAMWIIFFVLRYFMAHLKEEDIFLDENDEDE